MEEQKQTTPPSTGNKEFGEEKICGILIYIVWIVGIIWYFADPKMRQNAFAKFHAKQGIMLVILGIVISILYLIPYFGWFFISWAGSILMLVLAIMGIINVVKGEMKPLPVIGNLAEKWLKF